MCFTFALKILQELKFDYTRKPAANTWGPGRKGESSDGNPAPCSASSKGTSFGITMTFFKDKPKGCVSGQSMNMLEARAVSNAKLGSGHRG